MSDLVSTSILTAGVGGLLYAGLLYLRAWRARAWPSVDGEIVVSRICHHRGGEVAVGIGTCTRRADIQYRYEVAGRPIQGKRICVGEEFYSSSDSHASRYVDRYPPGARVAVFYNPRNPGQSCLERRADGGSFFLLIGLAFVTAANII